MEQTKIKPSRWYYLFSLVIIGVGVACFAVFMVFSIGGATKSLQRVVMPGDWNITLQQPGKHTIFYEYRSVVNGRSYVTDQKLQGLRGVVVSRETGKELTLAPPPANISYESGVAGYAVMEFNVDRPGVYRFAAWYPQGSGQQVVLAVGQGVGGTLTASILGGVAIMLAGFVFGGGMAVMTFIKRRRAKRAGGVVEEPRKRYEPMLDPINPD
jgi:hypothetical protein